MPDRQSGGGVWPVARGVPDEVGVLRREAVRHESGIPLVDVALGCLGGRDDRVSDDDFAANSTSLEKRLRLQRFSNNATSSVR